jgi:hypothetical protein
MANAKALPNLQALSRSPSPAPTLPSEAVLDALKMMLIGASLNEVLTSLARLIEAHSEGMLCSIFLLDEDGLHLRYGVAADLPQSYRIGRTLEALFCRVDFGLPGRPPSCRRMAKCWALFACTTAKFGIRGRTTFSYSIMPAGSPQLPLSANDHGRH